MTSIMAGTFEANEYNERGERLHLEFLVIDQDQDNPAQLTCRITAITVYDPTGELLQRWPDELEETVA